MRSGAVILSVVLAACGRIGFDRPDGGGGDDDGSGGGVLVDDDCTEPGLLLYLAFDEPEGTTAADSSGNANNGALVGFAATPWATGKKGGALRFDGIDDRVDLGSPAILDDVRPLTVCAWIFLDEVPPSYATIVDKSLDGFSEGWNFYVRDTGSFGLFVNTDSYLEGGNLPRSMWRHVCGSWDGTPNSVGIDLFRDGNHETGDVAGGGTQFSSDASNDMVIGLSTMGIYPFRGLIDELRIYDHAMDGTTVDEIRGCSSLPADPS